MSLRILLKMVDREDVTEEVRAVFIMVLATVLRCYPLRADFMHNRGIERVLDVLDEQSNPVMEAVSYLIGYALCICPLTRRLLGQDKTYRQNILSKCGSFIDSLCCLQNYSSNTIAAMLFALQSFVLEDVVKSIVVNNQNNVLSNLIKCCHGEVCFLISSHAQPINDEPCSAVVRRPRAYSGQLPLRGHGHLRRIAARFVAPAAEGAAHLRGAARRQLLPAGCCTPSPSPLDAGQHALARVPAGARVHPPAAESGPDRVAARGVRRSA